MANTEPTTRERLAEAFSPLQLAARIIETAEDDFDRAKRAFEIAETRRNEIRAEFRPFFAAGVDVDVDELGLIVTRSLRASGTSFSLSAYKAEFEITDEMRKHIKPKRDSEHWKLATQ